MGRLKTWLAGLAVLLVFSLPACSLLSPSQSQTAFCTAVALVQAEQQTVQLAAATIVSLNQQGKVPASTYQSAKQAYALWATADANVIGTLVAWNDANASPSASQAQVVATLLVNLATLFMQFQQIYGPVMAAHPTFRAVLAAPSPVAAVATCNLTDQQIQEMVPPAWPGP
jgi:hypothetical protein